MERFKVALLQLISSEWLHNAEDANSIYFKEFQKKAKMLEMAIGITY